MWLAKGCREVKLIESCINQTNIPCIIFCHKSFFPTKQIKVYDANLHRKRKEKKNEPNHRSYSKSIPTWMTSYCRWYFWTPCKARIGFVNNSRLLDLIRLTPTVSEIIGWRFIFRATMESAPSDAGSALWGLQPLLLGRAHWLQTDLEAGVWPALFLNQQSLKR